MLRSQHLWAKILGHYPKQNWIRMWFLREDFEEVSSELDVNLVLGTWLDFMETAILELNKYLREDGVMVLVIGDVARSGTNVISPARELIRRIEHDRSFSYIGCISDHNVEGKTTRVWKETKGKATAIDRVVILSNVIPEFEYSESTIPFFGNEDIIQPNLRPETFREHAREFAGLT